MQDLQGRKRVVVIGGGITGLTAGYRLRRAAPARGLPLEVVLLEASGRLGGIIATTQMGERLIEHGPDSFLTTKPWGMQLCEELELTDEMIGTTTQHRRSFVVSQGKLQPVPQGFYLMAPGSLWPFLTTPIFTWPGKLRMALDLLLPRRKSTADESLAQFVTRRLGREALERMAQPMVGGIYTADPQQLSLQATMPQFLDMEQHHGSIIRALWHNQRAARQQAQGTSGARYGMFASFRQGMQTLVDRLAAALPPEAICCNSRVTHLHYQPETKRWLIGLQDQPALEADAVCLTLAAPQAGHLLREADADLATMLQGIPYASSAILNLVYRRADIAHPLNGMGFVVPAIEKRAFIACSFSSVKFAGRAPQDEVLLRVFVGGALQQAQYAQDDADILQAVCQDLHPLLGIAGAPLDVQLSRYPQAMAQYHLGHTDRVTRLESLLYRLPGLVLAGNAYHGVGIPDCIRSGDTAAHTLLDHLEQIQRQE